MTTPNKEQGLSVLTLLIAAVVLFGALSAVVSVSRAGFQVSGESVKPYASAIITQGTNLATAFQTATARGYLDSTITFDAGTNGLLNPAVSGLPPQTPPNQAFSTAYAKSKNWVYSGNKIKVKGVGVDTNADYTFVVAGLTSEICAEINRQLGYTASGTLYSAGAATDDLVTTPAAIDLTGTNVTLGTGGTPAFSGLMQACIKGSTDYFYYVVVESQ